MTAARTIIFFLDDICKAGATNIFGFIKTELGGAAGTLKGYSEVAAKNLLRHFSWCTGFDATCIVVISTTSLFSHAYVKSCAVETGISSLAVCVTAELFIHNVKYRLTKLDWLCPKIVRKATSALGEQNYLPLPVAPLNPVTAPGCVEDESFSFPNLPKAALVNLHQLSKEESIALMNLFWSKLDGFVDFVGQWSVTADRIIPFCQNFKEQGVSAALIVVPESSDIREGLEGAAIQLPICLLDIVKARDILKEGESEEGEPLHSNARDLLGKAISGKVAFDSSRT